MSERIQKLFAENAESFWYNMNKYPNNDYLKFLQGMDDKKFFQKLNGRIEKLLPMTLSSFLMFAFIIYLFIIVGRSIWINYNSNKSLETEEQRIDALEEEIVLMKHQIAYYQTVSFKEKEARQKLGYKAPGETVMSLPLDKEEDKVLDPELGEVKVKTKNYKLWWKFLMD